MSRESKILIGVLVLVVGSLIGVFALANGGSSSNSGPTPSGSKTVTRPSSHKEGSGEIQMVEFGDYQCPACGAAFPNVQQLLKDYGSHISFYFRNFPLTQIHPNAMVGAEAAALQNKFWQMHDLLYQKQSEWSELGDPSSKLDDYASQLGLDISKFDSDRQSAAVKQTVQQDMADGNALGINATPTLYVNGTQVQGGYDYNTLKTAIDAALKK